MSQLKKAKHQRYIMAAIRLELERRHRLRWIYATEYHHNTRGEPMTFDDKPYLIPVYCDNNPQIVVKKSVQCGISEWAVCDCLSLGEMGLNTLYVLPKYTLRNRFVKRIDKAIARSSYYQERIGDVDSLWQKRYSGSNLVFASSETDSDFIEFPADCVIVDELDKCDQENIALAPDRLSASRYKYQRDVSTPTHEDYGIDASYKDSDQKEWHIQCEHCDEWQPLDFFVNVCREIGDNRYELIDAQWDKNSGRDVNLYCQECGEPIDRLSAGEWVAVYPDRNISGYHISKLFSANAEIAELWKTFTKALTNPTLMQIFFNSDLGLAYSAEGDRLSQALLRQCIGDYSMPSVAKDERVYMGVDVGNLLHIVIGTKEKILFIGARSSFSECSKLMKKFDVVRCVVDMRPETRKAREFQDEHKAVWLCEYINSPDTRHKTVISDKKKKVTQAHRTQSIDSMIAKFSGKEIKIPRNISSEFYDQMAVPVRIIEDRARGPEAIWTKGVDHYFHAMNYWSIAQQVIIPIYVSF